MINTSRRAMSKLAAALSVFVACQTLRATAAEHPSLLAPYVSEDTFAIACVDVSAIPTPKDIPTLIDKTLKLPNEIKSLGVGLLVAEGFVQHVQEAGAHHMWVVAGLGDVHEGGGPLLVLSARSQRGADVERALNAMRQEIIDGPDRVLRPIAQQLVTRRNGDIVLFGMKSTVERYTSANAVERNDLLAPLDRLGDNSPVLSVVFCPGPDFRRVVRELWPELPGVLAPLRGELADRWLSLEGSINLPPNMSPHLALQAKDAESAQIFAKLWHDLPKAPAEFGGNDQSTKMVQGYAHLLVDTLPAKVDGTRVEIGFPTEIGQFAALGSMFSEAASKSMESSHRRERVDRFKQILIAMFNYEAEKKHLPPAAICDKDGKPLLSWRVAVLPYLGEVELYKQFHLDEPWDSPHNQPLVAKMPTIYTDPSPAIQSVAGAGKTTFQVPVGKETMFYNNEGTTFREISDGTANTIAVIEVDPQRAVEWTKPADWNVDLAHPREGFGDSSRDYVTAGYGDGHVTILSRQQLDDKHLRALLTRAGGEPSN